MYMHGVINPRNQVCTLENHLHIRVVPYHLHLRPSLRYLKLQRQHVGRVVKNQRRKNRKALPKHARYLIEVRLEDVDGGAVEAYVVHARG